MWNKISNWWNKEKIELQQKLNDANERLDNTLRGLDEKSFKIEELKKTNIELLRQIEHRDDSWQDAIDRYDALHHEFDEFKKTHPDMKAEGVLTPWFVVGVDGENELKGLKTYMDWNDAMIQHMKDKKLGYKTDDEMIQHFIAQLYEHVLMLIESKIIDDSDIHRKNEFE